MKSMETVKIRRMTLICVLAGLFVAAGSFSREAIAAHVNSEFDTLEFHGVSGQFGIVVEYNPQEILTRPSHMVTVSYSPSPLPVSIRVNILKVLSDAGYDIPSMGKFAVELAASTIDVLDPWNVTLPVAETPIGRYTVQSYQIYPGLPVFLDLTLDGQVNATVSTASGPVEGSPFVWKKWGGQEVNLTAPSSAGTSTVTASFTYFVSAEVSVRFELTVFDYSLPLFSFPLGELAFQQTAQSIVEVVDTCAASGNGISTTDWILVVVAAIVGLVIGIVLGWLSSRKTRTSGTPPPGWTPPPPS